MVSFLTSDSLKRLEKHIELHSGPFIDFVQGMILQNRGEWFNEHKPLSQQIVHLVSSHKAALPFDTVVSITAVFHANGWLYGLREDSLNLFGTTPAIANGFSERISDIFNHYINTGNLPDHIQKQDFPEIVAFGRQLQNPSFFNTFLGYFTHFLIIKEAGFDYISLFRGQERTILNAYFSKKGISSLIEDNKLVFPFSNLKRLLKDPAYSCALSYIDVLWVDEKADPAEVGAFSLADTKLKASIKEVLVDGYIDPVEPILRELQELRAVKFVNLRPTQKLLSCLMGIAFKLQIIEFDARDIKQIDEPIEVSSALFNFLQSKKVNFPYRKISSVRA